MSSPPSFKIDRDSPLPLYKQVERWLRSQIEAGVYRPGDMLPSTKALCESFGGINHLTVRQAISSLVQDGLLFSVHGRGTYVREPKEQQLKIALVLPNLDDEFTREIAKGAQEVLDRDGADGGAPGSALVMLDSRRNAQKEIDNIGHIEDLPLDGAIIMPLDYGDLVEHLVRLKSDDFPLVLVDSVVEGVAFPAVTSDNYNGGYLAAQHLLERGRRNLAWFGNCKGYFSARQRFEGFRDAINDRGLAYNRKWMFEYKMESPTASFLESMGEIVTRIVREKMPIDGIVCASDVEAVACVDMLQERGVGVPGQIAVVGFDDIAEARRCIPPLTTVRQPMREMGRRAAQMILKRIRQSASPEQIIKLPVELIVREST